MQISSSANLPTNLCRLLALSPLLPILLKTSSHILPSKWNKRNRTIFHKIASKAAQFPWQEAIRIPHHNYTRRQCVREKLLFWVGERKQSTPPPQRLMEMNRGCIYEMIYTRSGKWVQKSLYCGVVAEMIKTNADCYLPLFLCERTRGVPVFLLRCNVTSCFLRCRCGANERTHWDALTNCSGLGNLNLFFMAFWHRSITVNPEVRDVERIYIFYIKIYYLGWE